MDGNVFRKETQKYDLKDKVGGFLKNCF